MEHNFWNCRLGRKHYISLFHIVDMAIQVAESTTKPFVEYRGIVRQYTESSNIFFPPKCEWKGHKAKAARPISQCLLGLRGCALLSKGVRTYLREVPIYVQKIKQLKKVLGAEVIAFRRLSQRAKPSHGGSSEAERGGRGAQASLSGTPYIPGERKKSEQRTNSATLPSGVCFITAPKQKLCDFVLRPVLFFKKQSALGESNNCYFSKWAATVEL